MLFVSVLSFTTSGEIISDQQNDIWHQEKNEQTNKWEWIQNNLTNYSYIDIKDISYDKDDEFVIIVNLSDSINTSKIIGCELYYGSYSPYQYYKFYYSTDSNNIEVSSFGFSFFFDRTLSNPLQNNNTQLRMNTSLPIDDDAFTLWGFTFEYDEGYTNNWADFFPSSFEPTDVDFTNQTDDTDNADDTNQNQTGNNGDNGDSTDEQDTQAPSEDTPGFEIALLVGTLILIVSYTFKRKK